MGKSGKNWKDIGKNWKKIEKILQILWVFKKMWGPISIQNLDVPQLKPPIPPQPTLFL